MMAAEVTLSRIDAARVYNALYVTADDLEDRSNLSKRYRDKLRQAADRLRWIAADIDRQLSRPNHG